MARPIAAIALVAVLAAHCSRTPQDAAGGVPATAAVTSGLPAVTLPSLAALSPPVQEQIRAADAALGRQLASGAADEVRATAYANLGRLLMAAKFADEAVLCYAHAEALEPGRMQWPYLHGHALLRKGRRADAAAAFERAYTLAPSDVTVLVWLGETQLDDGQVAKARQSFERALSVQPQSTPALFGAGRAALAQQQYADAARHLAAAARLEPTATAVHYPLAMAYRGLGNREQAEVHLRQRGSAYPSLADPFVQADGDVLESAIAYEERGMQALRSGDFAAADAAFRRGLLLSPDDASLRYWRGATLFAAGQREAAEQEFLAVLARSPQFAKAHFSLGMIYKATGRSAAALGQFQRAVAADPGLPEARLHLGQALQAEGDLRGAFEQYRHAVRIDPMLVEAWIGGVQTLAALRRARLAAEWRVDARRLHPGRPEFAEPPARLPTLQ